MNINIFIQARLSSSRYPGKVIAPLYKKPLITHIIERAQKVQRKSNVIVLTSTELSDDPLVAYLKSIKCLYFRGNLENVFDRFQQCARHYPCDYFVRLCADSPLIEPKLIDALLDQLQDGKVDLISNAFGKKFPKGQSVEILKTNLFLTISPSVLSDYEREHVMPYFYNHQHEYHTLLFDLTKSLHHINMCVDNVEDLKKLESSPYSYHFNKTELCKTL